MLRRHFLSNFALAATASGFVAMPAQAMSLEPAPSHLRLGVPSTDGAVDWSLLAEAGETRFRDGAMSRFPAALRALHNTEVTLTGYMMPFSNSPAHSEFLLGGMQFHCSTCMMGDLTRIVAVRAAQPVALNNAPLMVRGKLSLIEQDQSPLYFRLDGARAA
ncbi:hypothetical protein V6B08_17900 [Ferrovibrio sp. MS7]|uniref:hypothetical protein n=1 Tax=Ferrovibrio plantarum TaxID=3119164 RepID=UPI003134EF00